MLCKNMNFGRINKFDLFSTPLRDCPKNGGLTRAVVFLEEQYRS